MSYPRPRETDEDNYEKFVKLEPDPDRALVFCVECDTWHQIVLQAMASIESRAWMERPQINEINLETASLTCGACGVSVEYLLSSALRAQAIKHILGDYCDR